MSRSVPSGSGLPKRGQEPSQDRLPAFGLAREERVLESVDQFEEAA
jgi:hypothetical protein